MSIEQPIKTDGTPEPKEDLILFLKGLVNRAEKCEAVLELSGGVKHETRQIGDPKGHWRQCDLTGRVTIDLHVVLQMPKITEAEREAAAKKQLPEGWAPMPCHPIAPVTASEYSLPPVEADDTYGDLEPMETSPEEIWGGSK